MERMLAALGNGVQRDESLFRGARIVHHDCNLWTGEPIPMGNHRLESRVRENRTHGSEGGDGESRFRPLSIPFRPHKSVQPDLVLPALRQR